MRRKPRALWIALLTVLWMAFSLRVMGIDQQSIWYDEGLSIYYARGNIGQVLSGISQSEHPPLHSLLLHPWIGLCGDSELSVRMLSAWWGVLAVALLYRVGRRLAPTIGAIGALLLAVSPFAIWFSQETRGYMLALGLIIGTVDVALDLFPPSPKVPAPHRDVHGLQYLAYATLATAALYTHFYSGLVLLALNLAFLAQLVRSGWNVVGPPFKALAIRWLEAQIAVLALFAPWLPFVATQLDVNATYWRGAVDWKQIATRTLIAFGTGKTLDGQWAVGAAWALSLLALLGTYALYRRRNSQPSPLLLWLWMIVPTLFQIVLNRSRAKFAPRYLMNALPAYLLLASAGAIQLFSAARQHAFKIAGWTATVALLVTTATIGGATTRSLGNHYFDQRFYRPDFRAVVRYIKAHAAPDDLIVLIGGYSYTAFTYYYRGSLPVVPLPDSLLPTTREPIDLRTLETLNQAIAGRQRLWLVLWQALLSDPTGLITDELEHTYHRLGVGQTFHDVSLLLFDVSPGPLLAESTTPQSPLRADLDGKVRFLGYDLPAQAVRPGGTLYLYLYWESLTDMHHDYKVFTQVLDQDGRIIAQHDKIAGADAYPTSTWPPGAIVRDRFMLTVHPQTMPGQYPLIIGLYRSGRDLPRLPVRGEGAHDDHILLAKIEVQDK